MSHDRGCHCGREKWDYESCDEPDCPKAELVARWADEEARSIAPDPHTGEGCVRGETVEVPLRWPTLVPHEVKEKFMEMGHLRYLERVARADVEHVLMKERTYKGSWKKRGGVGAFMMLARKWDRLEGMLEDWARELNIFDMIMAQAGLAEDGRSARQGPADIGADGTALAEVRDLRRYLLLVEAEMLCRMAAAIALDGEEVTGDSLERAAPLHHGPGGMKNPRGYEEGP